MIYSKMTYKEQLKKISAYEYELPKTGGMNVPGKIFASAKLMEKIEDDALKQVANVACLPGIYKYSLAMPDLHTGYGFGIGGVAALDYKNGGLSPGGIGYDINCGVRLLRTNLKKENVYPNIKELLESLFKHVPAGLGSSNIRISKEELDKVLAYGAKWAVDNGYGNKDDLEFCEENGCMKNANASYVSQHAKDRGFKQLATLGSGNHFLEIQYVDEIFDKKAAEAFGIKEKGQVMLMIHCGSRGLGHQVCSDYLREMEKELPYIVEKLPDRELIYAPANHELCQKYFSAMAAAANFAWCNRHIIGHQSRLAFKQIFPESELKTIYDVAHNIAKIEEHNIDGKKVKVYMHRKGATRAFGPGNMEIPASYRGTGQPILIPGSMGTASYVLVGTAKAEEVSFASTAHGAGREMSRHEALRNWRGEQIKSELESRNIFIKSASWKGIAEEAPGAYKDIDEVVDVSDKAGIGRKVARLKPIGVIKG
jgi:tRNA-splicing ligase RtcB